MQLLIDYLSISRYIPRMSLIVIIAAVVVTLGTLALLTLALRG